MASAAALASLFLVVLSECNLYAPGTLLKISGVEDTAVRAELWGQRLGIAHRQSLSFSADQLHPRRLSRQPRHLYFHFFANVVCIQSIK